MSAFQQAVSLNNQGIGSLLEGNCKSAIEAMSMSIKLMKAALPQASTCDAAGCTKEADHKSSMTSPTVVIPSMESSDTIVFNQAICLPTSSVTSDVSRVRMNVYIGAVIYNLALAHQSIGTQALLNKAEKLYSLSLKLMGDDCTLRSSRMALIIKLGSINNLSQIRYSNGDYENAREGLSHVSHFMHSNEAMFQEPEIMGLLMNVLLLKPPSVASAA